MYKEKILIPGLTKTEPMVPHMCTSTNQMFQPLSYMYNVHEDLNEQHHLQHSYYAKIHSPYC